MILYSLLKEHKSNTGHYVIDSVGKPAHKEVVSYPKFLIIEEEADGIFLYKYEEDGSWRGDTWHPTILQAKEQAKFEYGESIEGWKELPKEIPNKNDAVEYILKLLEKKHV